VKHFGNVPMCRFVTAFFALMGPAPGLIAQQYCLSGIVTDATGHNTFSVGETFAVTATVQPGTQSCVSGVFCSASIFVQAHSGAQFWVDDGAAGLVIMQWDGSATTVQLGGGVLLTPSTFPPTGFSFAFQLNSYPADLIGGGTLPGAIPVPTPTQTVGYFRLYDGHEYDDASYTGQTCASATLRIKSISLISRPVDPGPPATDIYHIRSVLGRHSYFLVTDYAGNNTTYSASIDTNNFLIGAKNQQGYDITNNNPNLGDGCGAGILDPLKSVCQTIQPPLGETLDDIANAL
jgi:hypothetical protein